METIRFPCPNCNKALQAPAAAAGKIGKCSGCQTAVKVPVPALVVASIDRVISPHSAPAMPLAAPNQSLNDTIRLPIAGRKTKPLVVPVIPEIITAPTVVTVSAPVVHRRRLGQRHIVLLASGAAAIGVVIVISLSFLVLGGPAEMVPVTMRDVSSFDGDDLTAWAKQKMPELDVLATSGNAITVNSAKQKCLNELQPLQNKTIDWSLRVEAISTEGVYLQASYDSLVLQQPPKELGFEAMQNALMGAIAHQPIIFLALNKAVSVEQARALQKGQVLQVKGMITSLTIEQILHGNVFINEEVERSHAVIVAIQNIATHEMHGKQANILKKEEAKQPDLPPATPIAISKLYRGNKNQLSAEKEYSGKRWQVTGIIVDSYFTTGKFVLADSNADEARVYCSFPPIYQNNDPQYKNVSLLASLVGKEKERNLSEIPIVVEGEYSGSVENLPLLSKCKLITPTQEINDFIAQSDKEKADTKVAAEVKEEKTLIEAAPILLNNDKNVRSCKPGTIVEVIGTVTHVKKNWQNQLELLLQAEIEGRTFKFYCNISSRNESKAMELESEQVVTIRGRILNNNTYVIPTLPSLKLDPIVILDTK